MTVYYDDGLSDLKEVKNLALRQALIEGEESGAAGELDMEAIRQAAKQEAGLTPGDA